MGGKEESKAKAIIKEFNESSDPPLASEVIHELEEEGAFSVAELIGIKYFCPYCGLYLIEGGVVHERDHHNDLDTPDEISSGGHTEYLFLKSEGEREE